MGEACAVIAQCAQHSGALGVGLSLVYRIVQDHRGQVTVDSKPGEGTSVHVTLPSRTGRPGEGRQDGEVTRP